MDKIEEVKKILQKWASSVLSCWFGKPLDIDITAKEISQLFDAECQARVERIFKEIENIMETQANGTLTIWIARWQALKKQEGITLTGRGGLKHET